MQWGLLTSESLYETENLKLSPKSGQHSCFDRQPSTTKIPFLSVWSKKWTFTRKQIMKSFFTLRVTHAKHLSSEENKPHDTTMPCQTISHRQVRVGWGVIVNMSKHAPILTWWLRIWLQQDNPYKTPVPHWKLSLALWSWHSDRLQSGIAWCYDQISS